MNRAETAFLETCLALTLCPRPTAHPETRRLVAQLRDVLGDLPFAADDTLRSVQGFATALVARFGGTVPDPDWENMMHLLRHGLAAYLLRQARTTYAEWRADWDECQSSAARQWQSA